MTRRATITTLACIAIVGCAAAPTVVGGDNIVHRDAIIYHAEQGKALVGRQQTEIADARADAQKWERSANAWQSEYQSAIDSPQYRIGWWICTLFFWWLTAVIVAFVARMIVTVWPGGLVGEYLAHLFTAMLGILTCFVTYFVNIPDNVFFRRAIAAKDRTIAELQSQLQAATLAAVGATGAAAGAAGGLAAVTAAVGGDAPASIEVSAGSGSPAGEQP